MTEPEPGRTKLRFEQDPVSYILVLSDNLHEFERKKVCAKKVNDARCAVTCAAECSEVIIEREAKRRDLEVTFKFRKAAAKDYCVKKANWIFTDWAKPDGLFDKITFK